MYCSCFANALKFNRANEMLYSVTDMYQFSRWNSILFGATKKLYWYLLITSYYWATAYLTCNFMHWIVELLFNFVTEWIRGKTKCRVDIILWTRDPIELTHSSEKITFFTKIVQTWLWNIHTCISCFNLYSWIVICFFHEATQKNDIVRIQV